MNRWILGLCILAVAALAIRHPVERPALTVPASPAPIPRTGRVHASLPPGAPSIVVYVAGAVARPGLYRLPSGARAAQAVARAGGLLAAADAGAVNLAAVLADAEEVDVPLAGAPPVRRGHACNASKPRARRAHKTSAASAAPVDLNTAGARVLSTLPGIGPLLAQRIVTYRSLNGPFASLDELADVAGMTDRRIEKVTPFLVVH